MPSGGWRRSSSAKHRGEWIDPSLSRITVGEWAARWLEAQVQLKPLTRERYRNILRVQVLPAWERVRIAEVTHADVVAWIARLQADGYAAATIRQTHRVFSLMMALAVRDRRLSYNPAEGVRLPRVVRKEPVFLTHEQVDRLARACTGYELFIRLLAYTGLRWGEATALQVKRIDPLRRRLHVVRTAIDLGGSQLRHPEDPPAAVGADPPVSRRRAWPSTWPAGIPRTWCSPLRAARRCGTTTSGLGCSRRPPRRSASRT